MNKPICVTIVALAGLLCLQPIKAVGQTVLTFDDLPGDGNNIPNGYGGLNWDSMGDANWDPDDVGDGYQHGAVSGKGTAFNAYAQDATVSGPSFNFIGAYFTGAWHDGIHIRVTGYKNSVQLYEQEVVASFFVPTFFEFDFNNIDTLTLGSFGGTPEPTPDLGIGPNFVMDNFTFTPVPEPSSLILLGFGALSFLAFSKRLSRC